MSDTAYTIGEVAARAGLRTSTLRYYDAIGLVAPTGRVGGQRRYDDAALRRLRLVGLFRRAGFSLHEIARLLGGGGDWQEVARRKAADLEERVAGLADAQRIIEAALACGCADPAHCAAAVDASVICR